MVRVTQDPQQPAVHDLLPGRGSWRTEGVGVRLEKVPDVRRHLGERPAASSSVLHQGDLAAQQVKPRPHQD